MTTLMETPVTGQPQNEGTGGLTFFSSAEFRPTIAEIDHADQFADYDVVEKFLDAPRNSDVEGPDGEQYRYAGVIQIVPYAREFRLLFKQGVREYDILWLRREVQRVQAGYFNATPWTERDSVQRPGEKWFRVSLSYAFPGPGYRLGDVVVPCTEDACVDSRHREEDPGIVVHTGPITEGPTSTETGDPIYSMRAQKYGHEEWRLSLDVDNEPFTAEQASSFANDLIWARADVARLNNEIRR